MPARKQLYESLPGNAIVAEIGVYDGQNARFILEANPPKELWLIDPWEAQEGYEEFAPVEFCAAEQKVRDMSEAFCGKVKIVKEYSTSASNLFENHYFDWIFLDARHDYQSVKEDLAHWLPKVKKGGYICGHDFTLQDEWKWAGVHGAVIEFILKYVGKKPEILAVWQELAAHSGICWYEGHTPSNVVEIVLKWIEHYPGDIRSFKLRVGDWVDDLNYEDIIEETKV